METAQRYPPETPSELTAAPKPFITPYVAMAEQTLLELARILELPDCETDRGGIQVHALCLMDELRKLRDKVR